MSDLNAPSTPWRAEVIQDFARSELFQRTFQEGMDLVEETAGYLDGASWLLVQRAVREGDMPPDAACEERYRLAAEEVCRATGESAEGLPSELVILLDRSERLYERVRHLDRRMYVENDADEAPHPVLSQHDRLKTAFGG
jgi:regulator of CtrA degradation